MCQLRRDGFIWAQQSRTLSSVVLQEAKKIVPDNVVSENRISSVVTDTMLAGISVVRKWRHEFRCV